MKTKIVYVVVSNGKDTYLEQAFLSLVSLKEHNPDAVSCLVVDGNTNQVIPKLKYNILSYVCELICVDVPSQYTGASCSRYIKSSLREYVSGPYLFVDTDTVIAGSLHEIDNNIVSGINLACVKDSHLLFKNMPQYNLIIERAEKIGWSDIKEDKIHFNSGVMFVNDNQFTHEFYKQWHQNWLLEQSRGYHYDQLALARTNRDMGFPIQEMSGEWNYQIYYGALQYLFDAKIIHYAGDISKGRPYYFRNKDVFEELITKGILSEEGAFYLKNPKKAFVGKNIVIGEEDWEYYWSCLRVEYKYHKIRFHIWESLSDFFQKASKKIHRNKKY